MAKKGRPTKYTKALGDDICSRIAGGESLRSICKDEAIPSKTTVFRWLLSDDHKTFRDQYEYARQMQAEGMADELMDIADNSTNDYMERDGNQVLNAENIQRSRLRVDTRKWAASKLLPKKYGDKVEHDVNHRFSFGMKK